MPTYRIADGRTVQANDPEHLVERLRQGAADDPIFQSGGTAAEFTTRSAGRATALTGEPAVRADTLDHWYADMRDRGLIREVPAEKPHDFDRTVTVILATFAAFTGFTINGYLKDAIPDIGDLTDWRWWGFFSLVALLLRYIFGSAIHLNSVYVGKTATRPGQGWVQEREASNSQSIPLLFKDLLFLVVFGMLAIYIEQAAAKNNDPDLFIQRSMLFLEGGFLWSISDYFIRRIYRTPVPGRLFDWRWGPVRMDALFMLAFVILLIWELCSRNLNTAMNRSLLIIGLGMFLALIDHRGWFNAPRNPGNTEWPGTFWQIWAGLDGLQFLLTALFLAAMPYAETSRSVIIAVLFVVFLFLDVCAMIRNK
jgi:hypothetical protein